MLKDSDAISAMTTPRRLVEAVLDVWQKEGHAGVSARNLSHMADAPASAISYHFGGLEQLLSVAQDASIRAATEWCDLQRKVLLAGPKLDPAALGPFLAALIDDWCGAERRLALAWREGQLLAARNSTFESAVQAWRAMWRDFWTDVLDHFNLVRFADVTSQFFDGETTLHLIRWQRTIDRACLDELCLGWTAWLLGKPAGPGHWRAFARAEAARRRPRLAEEGPLARQIGSAAADLLGREGAGAVTHRAVAREAGATLGTVTYHFRTTAELLQAAFDAIYRSVTVESPMFVPDQGPIAMEMMRENIRGFAREELAPARLLALDELMGAAARDASYLPFAAVLRYFRGETSGAHLARVEGIRSPFTDLDAALFSIWSQGLRRSILASPTDERNRAAAESVDTLFALIRDPAI